MESQAVLRPARPPTVKELVAQAENINFIATIPFKGWTRAAETLFQEATFALSDADYGRAYMLLYRYTNLVFERLPKHPQFKDPDSQNAFKPLLKRMDHVIESLELIKPEIKEAHEEWLRLVPPPTKQDAKTTTAAPSYADFASRDPTLSGNAKILDAADHQELAVDLAQKELTRRDTARKATRDASRGSKSGSTYDMELQRQMEATRRTLSLADKRRPGNQGSHDRGPDSPHVSNNYNYPSVPKSRPIEYERNQTRTPTSAAPVPPERPPKQGSLPPRPEKEAHQSPYSRPPDIPRKFAVDDYQPLQPTRPYSATEQPLLPPKEPTAAPPIPKKERLKFKPGAYLENGDPIRSLFIPTKLRDTFLEIAAENTRAGLEMCGMLCGTPINNALFIRCLLIPDQKCTPDTCETENESGMFDYCMSEDLMVLGWIHTHPTQTCFMSSRDLHTHAGYQVMMPESVAIVCAPKFADYGTFRLTHPPGLNHILDCHHSDTFHQHSIDNLYREAEHPQGHVYENDNMPFYVHDLRTK